MQRGRLRHKVTIQQRVETQDASGEVLESYTGFLTTFASIEALSGRELFAAQQVQSEVSTRIRIGFRPGVKETMRVLHTIDHGSPEEVDVYDIQAVLPDRTGRREVQLLCVKRGADGFRSNGS